MPVRRTQPAGARQVPYEIQKSSSMAGAISPRPLMDHWPGMGGHTPSPGWQAHLQPYQTPTTMHEYSQAYAAPGLPAQAPAMVLQAPPTPVASSHRSHSRRPSSPHGVVRSTGAWTAQMDQDLMAAQARGLRWDEISKLFPTKSANACRKRYGRAKDETRPNGWSDEKIARLMLAYNKEGTREKMWSMISQEIGDEWQAVERMCFSQGLAKMTRTRGIHVHGPSRQSIVPDKEASRYRASSNDVYDARDDSGIGLGLGTTHHHHFVPNVMPPITMSGGLSVEGMLHPGHHYSYRQ